MTDLRLLALDGPYGPDDEPTAPDAPPDPIEAQRPAVGLTEDAGDIATFYLREWRGGPLYGCPVCAFVSRSDEGVARHVVIVHTPVRAPTPEERAERAGIIIATR